MSQFAKVDICLGLETALTVLTQTLELSHSLSAVIAAQWVFQFGGYGFTVCSFWLDDKDQGSTNLI